MMEFCATRMQLDSPKLVSLAIKGLTLIATVMFDFSLRLIVLI